METKKLYDTNSHLRTFQAQVRSCIPGKDGWKILLDQTAFYPEGGGQPCDTGALGGVSVLAVLEQNDDIVHYCDGPLTPGETVTGEIDWERRFDLMQQHSGEHIVSGLIHGAFGYDNVGFHMGQDVITIDFNGELEPSQLPVLELRANEVVWQDLPVRVSFPDHEALASLPYRSKKELKGQVRLVEYPGVDLCACCGTHVEHTGEIGLIRLLGCQKFRGGVRMEMLCGKRALQYDQAVAAQNHRVSNLLSAKPLATADAVARVSEELAQCKFRLMQVWDRLFQLQAASLAGAGNVLLFEDSLDPDGVRRLAIAVSGTCSGRAAVFSGNDQDGYKYAVCQEGGDLRAWAKDLNQALHGRGGGKPNFIQGSVQAPQAEIRLFFDGKSRENSQED